MNQIDIAVHDTFHKSEVSAEQIADIIGVGYQVLVNKTNPNNEYHKLTLREAVAMQLATKTSHIHSAMGLMLGVNKPKVGGKGVMDALIVLTADYGRAVGTIHESMSDGILTDRERSDSLRMLRKMREAIDLIQSEIDNHSNKPRLRTAK